MNKHILMILLILSPISSTMHAQTDAWPKKMICSVPVADLRREPKPWPPDLKRPTNLVTNKLQESQLLLNEHIIAEKEVNGWLRIKALEQKKSIDGVWGGFPGWVQTTHAIEVNEYPARNLVVISKWAETQRGTQPLKLSIGTKLQGTSYNETTNRWTFIMPDGTHAEIAGNDVAQIKNITLDEKELRQNIIAKSLEFIGDSYSWGGCSGDDIDCSALTYLSFLTNGLQLPRNAHEQFLLAQPLASGAQLQPGDFIFFAAKTTPKRIRHVMLYIGNGNLMETTNADGIDYARVVPVAEKLGKKVETITHGEFVGKYFIYFGSYLNNRATLQRLRDEALRTEYNFLV